MPTDLTPEAYRTVLMSLHPDAYIDGGGVVADGALFRGELEDHDGKRRQRELLLYGGKPGGEARILVWRRLEKRRGRQRTFPLTVQGLADALAEYDGRRR